MFDLDPTTLKKRARIIRISDNILSICILMTIGLFYFVSYADLRVITFLILILITQMLLYRPGKLGIFINLMLLTSVLIVLTMKDF